MPDVDPTRISQLLHDWARGNEHALGDLVPLVYNDLRRLAHRHLRSERPNHALQRAGHLKM